MDKREYVAPRGFEIDTVLVRCVHCGAVIDSNKASLHRVEHGIEQAKLRKRTRTGGRSDRFPGGMF